MSLFTELSKQLTAPLETINHGGDKFIEDDFVFITERRELSAQAAKRTKPPLYLTLLSHFLTVLTFFVAAMLAWRLFALGSYYYKLHKADKVNKEAMELVREATRSANDSSEPVISIEEIAPNPISSEYIEPEAEEEAPAHREIRPEIAALRERFDNMDIIGVLTIEGTNIDYPVVRGRDNEYYLTHDIAREESAGGAIFLDYTCAGDMSGRNVVIYGHNMRNGSQFHDLRYFVEQAFAEEHALITLTTTYDVTEWEVFAAYDASAKVDYIRTWFNELYPFSQFLDEIKSRNDIDMTPPTNEDRVLTLSTCAYTGADMRYAIHAKLVSGGGK